MEFAKIAHHPKKICRVGIGTWAIGGWRWGGTDEQQAIQALHTAFDLGINLIDTAPIYGFGVAEEIVGRAIKTYKGKKDHLFIATKAGINWKNQTPFRDSSKKRIFQEIEDSLKRLGVESIDLYQIHWPDTGIDFAETAEALMHLRESGKIAAIGVSNFSVEEMKKFKETASIQTLQSPYNLFETEIDLDIVPYCKKEKIALIGYGSLCRGLLSGKINELTEFKGDDLRKIDPKFQKPRFSEYLECVEKLKKWAESKYKKSILSLAVRWCLDKGIEFPLWGVRKPEHLADFHAIWDWKLTEEDKAEIATILVETLSHPVGPEFMAPSKNHKKVKVES